MPTVRAFETAAPFPEDVPTYELPRLMLGKLLSDDAAQSQQLFDSFQEHGFALLDMTDCTEGRSVLEKAEDMFEITRKVTLDLDLEEKMKYQTSPPKILHGYGDFRFLICALISFSW